MRRKWYFIWQTTFQLMALGLFRFRIFHADRVPRTGGVVLICNHQSFLDPVLATVALPRECHYMARDTLFKQPLFRRMIDSLNAFPVKRGSADVGAIKETLKRLKRGALVTVFPEGTRTPDGAIGPMQPGSVLIARKARVPLVPTLVLGAFEAWPRQRKLPKLRPILVAYGEPLTPDELSQLDDEAAVTLLRARIIALHDRFRNHPLVRTGLQPLPNGHAREAIRGPRQQAAASDA